MFLRKSHGQYVDLVWQIFVINLVYLHNWSLIEFKQFKGVAVVMGVGFFPGGVHSGSFSKIF